MKRMLVCAAVVALVAGAAPLPAGAGPGGPKGPKANPGASVKAGGPKAPKATGPKTPKSTGPKVTAAKSGGPKVQATGANAGASKGKTTAPGQVKRGAATTTGVTADTPEVGVTAAGPNVPKNPKLQARLQAMLPPGVTLEDAAAGFRNQGQFIAAVNVSNNLGIPFDELKFQMVDQQSSLGQAIQTLKPQADATVEAARAETQANQDLDR